MTFFELKLYIGVGKTSSGSGNTVLLEKASQLCAGGRRDNALAP